MFSKPTQSWFDATFPEPTEVQRRGWQVIARGDHALLVAPTGAGKTLAAFLAGIDSLATQQEGNAAGTRVLYVSPLKALVYDVERNLRGPLVGIQRTAEKMGLTPPRIDVAVRTGDTPQRERQRQVRQPGDILVTTPESLFLMLGSRARETFRTVHTVIIDEVHAVAATKRGTHLALSLERLSEVAEAEPQRIGLSATVRPLDEVARFLGGTRPVEVVDASMKPDLELRVTVPVPDMTNVDPPPESGGSILGKVYDREVGTPAPERGIWPTIYPKLLEEIEANRSTIIFTNSRGLCERLAQRLNELAEEEIVRSHHGSVSHEKRHEIEEGLKAGTIKGIVATSSLELGIDMGAVDRVILVESPGSVARGLQRVGRAGHNVGEKSVGRLFPKFQGDLLESAVISRLMLEGELESIRVPRNVLDVLAQQVVAMCCDTDRTVQELETIVSRAYPFEQLTRSALESVLDMLSGRYPSADFADLRPLLSWDRAKDLLSPRRGAAMISRMNPGTIPDRGSYAVHLGDDGPRVGELDEEMVFESRAGENILLGATTWRIEEITRDRVVVTPAPGETGKLPFWRGDGPGRPIEIGRAIGAFLRELEAVPPENAADWIAKQAPLDGFAATNLANYVREQQEHSGTLPTDRRICVERFRDELGDWRVCILTPFGARIHAPWSIVLQRLLTRGNGFDTQVMYSEDGIVLRFADSEEPPPIDLLFPNPDEVEDLLTDQLAETALFAGLFRENAVRSLLLPRRRPTQRNPLWAQRLKAQQLLASVRKYPAFPMVLESYRQAMRDVFDLPGLIDLLRDVRSRHIAVAESETPSASPFARSLVFAYVAAYMYEQDSPLAERRAQALTLDRNLLGELLGQAELRELIDADVLAQLEQELQWLPEDRHARDANEVHDLLRRLGDLTEEELKLRCCQNPGPWLAQLRDQRRAIEVPLGGQARWIAAEDAGVYRDALGIMPPAGLPSSFLDHSDNALEQLVSRFARHRGPFPASLLAQRFDLRAAQIEPVLRQMQREGTLVHGEIRPGGTELDYCDAEVLRRLKRRTLAKLRDEIAPVDARTLGRFLPEWHGIDAGRGGTDRILDVVAQLEGMALPWSEWIGVVFPRRVAGFTPDQLDALSASGAVLWVGTAPLGPRDGRVALYLRDRAGTLIESGEDFEAPSALHGAVLETLERRGASFLTEIHNAVRAGGANPGAEELETALWDLVWTGQVTNDTFGPLQSLTYPRRRVSPRRGRGASLIGGRWSQVKDLVGAEVSATERTLARARMLLERYGVVSREMTSAEDFAGGFGPIYRVLQAMEDTGEIRRGYFVEGLAGAQFAHAGAVDRLRACRPREDGDEELTVDDVVLLPAIDPANPYGALLQWPASDRPEGVRPRRVAGAWVLLLGGHPAFYLGPGGKSMLTFPFPGRKTQDVLTVAAPALKRIPRGTRRGRMVIEKIDGLPARESPWYDLLQNCGLERTYRGLACSRI